MTCDLVINKSRWVLLPCDWAPGFSDHPFGTLAVHRKFDLYLSHINFVTKLGRISPCKLKQPLATVPVSTLKRAAKSGRAEEWHGAAQSELWGASPEGRCLKKFPEAQRTQGIASKTPAK